MIKMNPVLKKELKVSVRTKKTAIIVFLYNLLLAFFGLFVFYGTFESNINNGGSIDYSNMLSIYAIIAVIQFGLILFIVPAVTSCAISGEREKQTLEILLTTKLNTMQIILGKLASSISIILLLVISSLPVLSIVFSIGGICMKDLLEYMLFIMITAIFIGSIGIFFSTLFKKTTTSTVFTYSSIIALIFGTVVAIYAIYAIREMNMDYNHYSTNMEANKPNLGNLVLVLLINPAVSLVSLFSKQFGSRFYLTDFLYKFGKCNETILDHWYKISITVQLILSVILILWSVKLLNPLNPKTGFSKKDRKKRHLFLE